MAALGCKPINLNKCVYLRAYWCDKICSHFAAHQVRGQQQQQQPPPQQQQKNDAVLTISTHDVVILVSKTQQFVIQLKWVQWIRIARSIHFNFNWFVASICFHFQVGKIVNCHVLNLCVFFFVYSGHYDKNVNVTFAATQNGIVDVAPASFEFKPNDGITKVTGTILGRSAGHVEISATSHPPNTIEYVIIDHFHLTPLHFFQSTNV